MTRPRLKLFSCQRQVSLYPLRASFELMMSISNFPEFILEKYVYPQTLVPCVPIAGAHSVLLMVLVRIVFCGTRTSGYDSMQGVDYIPKKTVFAVLQEALPLKD